MKKICIISGILVLAAAVAAAVACFLLHKTDLIDDELDFDDEEI